MKHKSYRNAITLLAICFLGTIYAQKFDKKFSENFNTNKDVEIAINASHTDINVTTWNKNEVQVNAIIEIEGVAKEVAEKYFKDWEFEALGNKRRVEILSKGNKNFHFRNDFVIFDDIDFDFKIPEIDMSNVEAIILPDMDFDFDFDFNFDDLEDLGEKMEKEDKYEFLWKDDDHDIKINSKKEWEAFKKTKEYKELKEKMRFDKDKMRKELSKSKEKMKKALKEARIKIKEVDREEVRRGLEKAKEELKKLNLNYNSENNTIILNNSTIKIKKKIEIKVPKGATFDLNTRHCKVKLPNTVAYGTVKYGSFIADNLQGGKLTIDYSSVTIKDLNACTLFLNNVTDAKIASVTNTALNNNYSNIQIIKVNENVNVSDKFGTVVIDSFKPDFGEFILNLSQSNATLVLGAIASKFQYNVNRVKLNNARSKFAEENKKSNNLVKINGDYSSIVIK